MDEADSAANNQVFLDFLAQLRAAYIDSDVTPTFQSVILAGVYDIRNMKQKIRLNTEHKMNSPWNIAAKFRVEMSFSVKRIADMLREYEADYHTGMDIEEMAGRYFMLFLKQIINGVGNCYVESETRNHERMDLVIDYRGEQYIIEMKVWHGKAYNERGEEQLSCYLDYFHLDKGYMLSFNFNKKKEIGVKDIVLGDKVLIEAVV